VLSGRVLGAEMKARICRIAVAGSLLMALGMLAGCLQPGTKIRHIYFTGNQHVSDDRLLDGMYARPDSPLPWREARLFDRQELERDQERVVAILGQQGYASARVKHAIAVPASEDEVNLYFDIDEGPPVRVVSVNVTGAPAGSGIDAGAIEPMVGDIFVYERYADSKNRIRDRLRALGYYHVDVIGRVSWDAVAHTVTVELIIDPGPLVKFGETKVEGATLVPPKDIFARVAWEKGEVYDPELVALTERRLYALGRFSSVHFDPAIETGDGVLGTTVHVAESKRFELRIGAGFATDSVHSEVRGRGGMTARGFPFAMTTLKLDGLVAPTFLVEERTFLGYEYKLSARADHEDFLLPRLRFGNEFDYSQQITEAYALEGPRGRLSLDRSFFRDHLALGVGWQIRYQDITEVSSAVSDQLRAILGLVSPYQDASYFQSLSLDLRDNPLESRRGFYGELKVQEGGAAAGGHFEYAKVTPELRTYVPVGRSLVMAARAKLGLGFGRGEVVPITERYFAGGASSHRGFAQQRLSPVAMGADGGTVPIGGEALLETSIEGRFDLERLKGNWLQLVLFLDGADVTTERAQLDPLDLHLATGAGLRYQTPVGPLRLDVGYRLNRKGAGEPDPNRAFNFFLGLGEAF
jgi:translocation and assembly module TamA